MYPWELGEGMNAPIHSEALPEIHETRLAMLKPAVREVLDAAERPTVIDLACNEGWFSHRMLELGADRVVGIDIREVNVRRARLVAEQMGIGEERLEFRVGDIYELDPGELGEFDVVLNLGLIYHLEDPMRAIRISRGLARRLCVIESQLTRQQLPLSWGRGAAHTEFAPASFAAYPEPDADENPVASAGGVLSLIPNRAAVEQMARSAGFGQVEMVAPDPLGQPYYLEGDRGLFLAWVSGEKPKGPRKGTAGPQTEEAGDDAGPLVQDRGIGRLRPVSALGRISLARRVRSDRKVASQLRQELEAGPPWMYPWRFAPGVEAPIHHEMLASVHETRKEMIEAPVCEVLAPRRPVAAGADPAEPASPTAGGPRAIDLACNEGWFSQRLLDWGAAFVLGVDIREVNIRRARLVAREFGIDESRLRFRQSDVFDLRPSQLGKFDVVLMLGLIYHLEDPAGAIRIARELCGNLCVIESQLTRQTDPLPWTAQDGAERGSFAVQIEKDAERNPLASSPGRMSLIPNAAAVEEMALAAGFSSVEQLTPPPLADVQYTSGDRGVFIARVDPPEL